MDHYKRLRKSPKRFRALTGLTPEKFGSLLKELEPLYKKANHKRLSGRRRKRCIGAGRKFSLSLGDRLLMLLVYYRTYITHEFIGFIFGVDNSTVSRRIRFIEPLLAGIFRIPERRISMTEDEIMEIFFDGTEQPVSRPGNGRRQKDCYSGKKKTHTLKHQVVTVRKKKKSGRKGGKQKRKVRIVSVSKMFYGKTHDKNMYDESRVIKPPGTKGKGDTGYLGTGLDIPHKKPKGKKLTERQKKHNRGFSSVRVSVEHAIGKMKIWRISRDKFRNRMEKHTIMFKNVAGLQNMMFA